MFHPTVTNLCPPYLNFLQISLNCCDPHCTSHHSDLNIYCVQLFNCIAAAADLCLPKRHQCLYHSPLSGWNDAALSLKHSVHFWRKVWTECGCLPLVFYSRSKRTAREGLNMKFAASVVVKVTSDMKSWLVLIYTSASLSFGSLLKRYLNLLEVHLPLWLLMWSMVVVMISSIFSSKLKSLLNSCLDPQSCISLYDSIRESISPSDLSSILITQEIVHDAMSQLKSGKYDGSMFMSNHFIYAKDALNAPLSRLFTQCFAMELSQTFSVTVS